MARSATAAKSKALAACGLLAALASASAYAQWTPAKYKEHVDYLRSLRPPTEPTAAQCASLSKAFDEQRSRYFHAHEKCLADNTGPQQSGKSCSQAACQPLHDLRDMVGEIQAAQSKLCNERVALTQAKQREWETMVRASQQDFRRQMEEAQQGAMRAGPPTAPPPVPGTISIDPVAIGEASGAIDSGAEYFEGEGNARAAAGHVIKHEKSIAGPVRYSLGDHAITSGSARARVASKVGTVATAIDTTAKAVAGDYGGVANNIVDETIDGLVSSACRSAGPGAPACVATYIGSKLLGDAINETTRRAYGVSARDWMTDRYFEGGPPVDPVGARADALGNQIGIAGSQQKAASPTASASATPIGAMAASPPTCATVQNSASRQQLAQQNRELYLQLWESCNRP